MNYDRQAWFGEPPDQAESEPTPRDMDIVASIQSVTEEIVLKIRTEIAREKNQKTSALAVVTHRDYSARIQTVDGQASPDLHALLSAFHGLTGGPFLINISVKVRGEPIVCTFEDAFYCFIDTDLDMLVTGNVVPSKDQQTTEIFNEYKNMYELD